MTPAHPPPPTNSNLPFQFSGSQTSILMSESALGFSVAATRQSAGTVRTTSGGLGRVRPLGGGGGGPFGGVKTPAGTDSAIVIVALGSEMDFRFEHGVGAARAAQASKTAKLAIIMNCPPELGENYHNRLT